MKNFAARTALNKNLRLIALFGTVAAVFYKIAAVSEVYSNQYYGFYALALIFLIVLASFIGFASTTLKIVRNLDLLVPIGLYITAQTLLGFLLQSSIFVGFRDGRFEWAGLTFMLAAGTVLHIALGIGFSGWMTRVLLRFVKTGRVELIVSLKGARRWFPRTLAFVAVGYLPFVLLMILISLPIALSGKSLILGGVIYPYFFVIGAGALVWNLATMLVLPYLLTVRTDLKAALIEGIKFSWARRAQTLLPVLLLMIVAGWILLISVTFSERTIDDADFGKMTSFSSRVTNQFNYSVNFVWTANYPESSKWHDELLKAVKEKTLAPVDLRVKLLMLLLSVLINLYLIEKFLNAKNARRANETMLPDLIAVHGKSAAIVLLLLFVPFEIVTQYLHSARWLARTIVPTNAQVISGEGFFRKQKIFEVGQENTASVVQKEDAGKFEVRGINDVAAGNLDGESGFDIIIASGKGTLILDQNGAIKKEIPYQIQTTDGETLNNHFSDQKIIDLDSDGVHEVINYDNYHAPAGIYDLQGKALVEFEPDNSDKDTPVLALGDTDGDRVNELYEISSASIKLFQMEKTGKIKAVFNDSLMVFNDGDGLKYLSNIGQAVITNDKGKILKKAVNPSIQNGYLFAPNAEPLSVFFGGNHLGLFDLDGKLHAKFAAPLSEQEYGVFEQKDELSGGNLKAYIFRADAYQAKLVKDQPPFVVVAAYQSIQPTNFAMMLYVYNAQNELVYQETFNALSARIRIVPSETGDRTENLLVTTDDKIWKYTAQ